MAIVIGKDGKAREYRAQAPAPRTMDRPFIPDVQAGVVSTDDGAVVPRRTDIYGQDHLLAYIRPDEAELLQGLGGMGTPGPGGLPQFGFWDSVDKALGTNFSGNNPPAGGSDSTSTGTGTGTSTSTDTSSSGSVTGTSSSDTSTSDDTSSTIGQVSSTGQYAGDGYEWKQNPGGYLTRTYTGAGKDNNLGTDVIQGGTAGSQLKEKIAAISLAQENKPETVFGETRASATDLPFLDLFRSKENWVGSASYADQVQKQQEAAEQRRAEVENQQAEAAQTADNEGGVTTGGKKPETETTGGMFGYGYDYDGKDGITFGEIIRDMTDGGGPGGPDRANPLNPVYKDAAGNELGQGFGRRLLGGIGRDLTMGLTAGVFTPLDQQAQKLIDAGYSEEQAEDYVNRTKENMLQQQIRQQQQQQRSDDGGSAKPPVDPCPKGYIMDPQKKVCVIDPDAGAGDDEDEDTGYQPPAYTPPPLSPYLGVGDTGGGFVLQPGSEDVSFMRRSGQYAGGGQVGLGSMNPFMGMYKFR